MTFFTSLETRLVHVVDNQEIIVGVIYDKKLLAQIVCELNGHV